MKNFITSFVLVFAIGLATLVSCQDENDESRQGAELLNKGSGLSQRIQRVTANDTSIDNVIDTTSCYSVKLPVRVMVSGQVVTVNTPADYQVVADLLQTPTGGTVSYVYPVTLVSPSYEETTVSNQDILESILFGCTEFEPISCLSINYPVTVATYDTNAQNPSAQTIDNDQEFYLMIQNLTAAQVYQIQYPISVTGSSGALQTLNSNEDFEAAIATAITNCACANPHILTDDLILYMPFANGVADLTNIGNPLAIGQTQFVTDRSGNANAALLFVAGNADNQVVTAGNAQNDMLQNNAFTVSIWFNRQIDNFQGGAESLFSTNLMDIVLQGPNGEIRSPKVIVNGAELVDNDWINGQLFTQVGVWHHIVVTYDGQVLSLYRDGVLRAEAAVTFPPSTLAPNYVGGNFTGFVDDVRVYKRALTLAQIQTLFTLDGDVNTCL